MFGNDDYLLSWGIYLLSAMVCLFIWWRMTRPVAWAVLRGWLRVSVAVLLLLPLSAYEGSQSMAPAVMALVFESMTMGVDASGRGGYPLLMTITAACLLVFLYHMLWAGRAKVSKK